MCDLVCWYDVLVTHLSFNRQKKCNAECLEECREKNDYALGVCFITYLWR